MIEVILHNWGDPARMSGIRFSLAEALGITSFPQLSGKQETRDQQTTGYKVFINLKRM